MSVWISPGVTELTRMLSGPEFARHRLAEAEDPGLGRRIMRTAEDPAAALRRDRRQADDRSALARAHVRNDRLAHVQRAAQRDVGHRLVVVRLDVHELIGCVIPALLTRTSICRAARSDCRGSTLAVRLAGDVAGHADVAGADVGRRRRAASASRSRIATRAPCSAKICAMAFPMPLGDAAPVMMATLSCSSICELPRGLIVDACCVRD